VATEHPAVGQAELRFEGLHHEQLGECDGLDPIRGATRHDQVVTDAVLERAVLGAEHTGAGVHEEQLVAVGIPQELGATTDHHPEPGDRGLLIAEQQGGPEVAIVGEPPRVIRVMGGRAVDGEPVGGRVQAVEVAGRPVEA